MDNSINNLLVATVQYGGYISIVKLVVIVAMFFLWYWITTWAHDDSGAVDTNQNLWTAVVFGAGAAAMILWLLISAVLKSGPASNCCFNTFSIPRTP